MAVKPTFPDYHCAMGRFLYYRLIEQPAPLIPHCPRCDRTNQVAHYGIGWCDDCGWTEGILPKTMHEPEELLLFRGMFNDMRAKGYDWEAIRHLRRYWVAHRRLLCKGKFKPDWIAQVMNAEISDELCLEECCRAPLGIGAIRGYCGNTCYQRAYRRDNKESIKLRRILRNLPNNNLEGQSNEEGN